MTDYLVTFRPTPEGPPAEVKLKRLLKIAGRAIGLRAIQVCTVSSDVSKANQNAQDGREATR